MALKPRKIREMSADEMSKQLGELKLELSKERAASEVGTVKNPGRIRSIRMSLARIHTIMNEKKRQVAAPKENKAGKNTEAKK